MQSSQCDQEDFYIFYSDEKNLRELLAEKCPVLNMLHVATKFQQFQSKNICIYHKKHSIYHVLQGQTIPH